jgi:hypothetical protein
LADEGLDLGADITFAEDLGAHIRETLGDFGAVRRQINEAKSKFTEAAEDEGQIRSPSRKTTQFGRHLGSGIAGGIADGSVLLRRQTRQMIQQSIQKAGHLAKSDARQTAYRFITQSPQQKTQQRRMHINNHGDVSPEMQAEIKRGIGAAMRYMRVPRMNV